MKQVDYGHSACTTSACRSPHPPGPPTAVGLVCGDDGCFGVWKTDFLKFSIWEFWSIWMSNYRHFLRLSEFLKFSNYRHFWDWANLSNSRIIVIFWDWANLSFSRIIVIFSNYRHFLELSSFSEIERPQMRGVRSVESGRVGSRERESGVDKISSSSLPVSCRLKRLTPSSPESRPEIVFWAQITLSEQSAAVKRRFLNSPATNDIMPGNHFVASNS